MKIQYVSDLHLEFEKNENYLRHFPLEVKGDILLIAGDSDYYLQQDGYGYYKVRDFWHWASDNYKDVILAMGNHEFYAGYDLATMADNTCGHILPNVRYCYNKVINMGDIDIIVSTLWSKIPNDQMYVIERNVNDFYKIKYMKHRLFADDFNDEHERCLKFIKEAVANSTAKTKIVMTHHVPTAMAVAPMHKNSPINGAFSVDLSDYIADSGIDYWIYGHSHTNIDCQIGKTKIISNQLGYTFSGEHLDNGFMPDKFIEV